VPRAAQVAEDLRREDRVPACTGRRRGPAGPPRCPGRRCRPAGRVGRERPRVVLVDDHQPVGHLVELLRQEAGVLGGELGRQDALAGPVRAGPVLDRPQPLGVAAEDGDRQRTRSRWSAYSTSEPGARPGSSCCRGTRRGPGGPAGCPRPGSPPGPRPSAAPGLPGRLDDQVVPLLSSGGRRPGSAGGAGPELAACTCPGLGLRHVLQAEECRRPTRTPRGGRCRPALGHLDVLVRVRRATSRRSDAMPFLSRVRPWSPGPREGVVDEQLPHNTSTVLTIEQLKQLKPPVSVSEVVVRSRLHETCRTLRVLDLRTVYLRVQQRRTAIATSGCFALSDPFLSPGSHTL
jgi:hypothetical protein